MNDASSDDSVVSTCDGGMCSLRGAVMNAKASSLSTTICIPDNTTITLTNEIDVGSEVTIVGLGPNVVLRPILNRRIFAVMGDLHLQSLDIGFADVSDVSGAAVDVINGSLSADHVAFHDNVLRRHTDNIEGAAIHARQARRIEITRSTFVGNRIVEDTYDSNTGRGAAIALVADTFAGGTFSITDTTFDGNRTDSVGGALFLAVDLDALTIERNLFVNNSSAAGGAIDVNCASTGTLKLVNSTFASNTTSVINGVIYVCGSEAIDLDYITATGNSAPMVHYNGPTGDLTYRGVAMLEEGFGLCDGNVDGMSRGFNVVTNYGNCPPATTDVTAIPGLEALEDNGGPTKTAAPVMGGAAVDTGDTMCPPIDQRGLPRPRGNSCDAGAVELQ